MWLALLAPCHSWLKRSALRYRQCSTHLDGSQYHCASDWQNLPRAPCFLKPPLSAPESPDGTPDKPRLPNACRLFQTLLIAFGQLLAPIALSAAALLLTLLALRDEVHLLTICLRDALGDNSFIKAADQLFD